MVAVGHLIGYGAGAIDLGLVFGSMIGDTQFKQLTVIAAVALLVAVGVTCWATRERVLLSDGTENQQGASILSAFAQIWHTTRHLPNRIQAICWIQFWSWIGWFPFLFYSSTWVGETYLRYDAPPEVRDSKDTLGDIGRVGSLSLIVFSAVTFVGSVSLPWLVRSPEEESKPGFTPRPPPMLAPIAPFLKTLLRHKPTLLGTWTVSHLLFTFAMIFAPFIASVHSATVVVATCGIPWALACWAPFTFMGIEINRVSSANNLPATNSGYHSRGPSSALLSQAPVELPDHEPAILHLRQASVTSTASEPVTSTGELAGVYLGILNLYTTLPQFVATGISMVVFNILEPGKSPELAKDAHPDEHHGIEGPNAIAVCMAIGAGSSVVAAWATRRLRYVR